uniref:Uncharacterized protein n=1 Tax=Anguilla anguilla TaxID=7936 RepID=A0A0E9UG14_ANGAN
MWSFIGFLLYTMMQYLCLWPEMFGVSSVSSFTLCCILTFKKNLFKNVNLSSFKDFILFRSLHPLSPCQPNEMATVFHSAVH